MLIVEIKDFIIVLGMIIVAVIIGWWKRGYLLKKRTDNFNRGKVIEVLEAEKNG